MKIKQLIYYFLLLALLPISGFAQTTYLPHYTTRNGLPSNNCYYTLQDKKGYIWIATDAGVSRFDGTVFENFSVDDGLPDNQILQLKEDSKGRIWFLSLNGQMSYYYQGKIYTPDNDKRLKQLNFNAIVASFLEDSKGRIWFGTNKNVIGVWDGNSLIKYASPDNENQYTNSYLYEDKYGNIWAASSKSVYLFIRNNFVLVKDKFLPISYKAIQKGLNKSIYFIDKNGLNIKNGPNSNLILKIKQDLILNSGIGYLYVAKNEIWLCNNSGVFIINFNGKTEHFIKDIDVNQVVKDRDQNIWLTTKNGIYKLPNKKERVYIFNNENGLTSNQIKSITKDKYHNLWMGTGKGELNILNLRNKSINKIDIPDKKRYSNIKELVLDHDKKKLYFASDYGLGSLNITDNSKSNIQYLKETNNSVFVVKSFSLDTTSKLALALSSGVVIINDRNKFEFSSSHYKEKQDYFQDRSYRVYYDGSQNLWFSNINGLTEFNAKSLNKYYLKHSILTKRMNDILQLPNGSMALATDGYGIIIFNNGKIVRTITQRDGLNNNIVKKLYNRDNFLWAISNNGINRISLHNYQINSFDYANDLLSDDLNDLYIDKDTAYFATNNGLIYFPNTQSVSQIKAPNIYISSIVNNKKYLELNASDIILKPNERSIIFNYSAIDFKNRKITYRYRLKNDANWIETKSRRLEFSSLEPGEYCFEVSAKSQDSQWSNPAKVTFTLEKHFYQTWWFLIGLLLIGAYVLYRIAVSITNKQKNKEQEQLLLKNKILMLEQRALQAMMNPHFVFNVMNSIQHYINTQNTSTANKVLTGFAKLIRKNLEICTKSYITLKEEIDYLKLYLGLEKYRFNDKLNYTINVDDQIDEEETLIPSMLLQPYIENAIWHGIMPKEEGGEVNIQIVKNDENYLWIRIIDNGVGIENSLNSKKGKHQSKGMNLTKERMNLLNKIEAKPIQLFVQQNGKSGTTITLLIPLD